MKNLVKLISLAVIVICMSNTSCEKQETTVIRTAEFDEQFELKSDEKLVIPREATELQIDLKSITDSRCPANATCVWEGNAKVKIDITFPGADSLSRDLCIGNCQTGTTIPGTSTVVVNGNSYTISLLEVNPYPSLNAPNNTKKSAVFVVRKN